MLRFSLQLSEGHRGHVGTIFAFVLLALAFTFGGHRRNLERLLRLSIVLWSVHWRLTQHRVIAAGMYITQRIPRCLRQHRNQAQQLRNRDAETFKPLSNHCQQVQTSSGLNPFGLV